MRSVLTGQPVSTRFLNQTNEFTKSTNLNTFGFLWRRCNRDNPETRTYGMLPRQDTAGDKTNFVCCHPKGLGMPVKSFHLWQVAITILRRSSIK